MVLAWHRRLVARKWDHASKRRPGLPSTAAAVRNRVIRIAKTIPVLAENLARCWFHKTANVLAALPKSAHPGAKKALAEIWGAEDKPSRR